MMKLILCNKYGGNQNLIINIPRCEMDFLLILLDYLLFNGNSLHASVLVCASLCRINRRREMRKERREWLGL